MRFSLKGLSALASKNKKIVLVHKNRNLGQFPAYLDLIQRHFEKSPPTEIKHLGTGQGSVVTFQAPLDLLRLVMPGEMVNELESIEITYRRNK